MAGEFAVQGLDAVASGTILMMEERAMDRISSIMPVGSADEAVHRGARRRTRRYAMSGEVEFLEPRRSRRARGVVINASAGGMRVGIDRLVEAGQECLLEIRTSAHRVWKERARVVWRRPLPDGCLMGLEFLEIG